MDITITDIEKYLEEVKAAINAGCYRIEMNDNRKDNQDLFLDYIISEEKRKQILLSLEATDFSEIRHNTHRGLRRFLPGEEQVSLYIKFNKLESRYVIVISFHKQKYPNKVYV